MRHFTNTQPDIITLSVRLYGWLLSLGPKEFREEYGEEALKDFRHCCRAAYMSRGTCGVFCLWPSMFTRGILDMGAERFSEALRQGKKRLSQASGYKLKARDVLLLIVSLLMLLILAIVTWMWSNTVFQFIAFAVTILQLVVIVIETTLKVRGSTWRSPRKKTIRQIPVVVSLEHKRP